ncbi:hypothetical protein BLNAU_2758 [Blattamonas nauphoetae]|uniref:Uncharacterized protein n=1 Tax=Blattamonas nauphoetae TaxID=2049346 RepID=A0ABQ9YEC2_9EUKA|nr:hypothetical protein BLNAU_2758 [Blattamonas nauphoetae]
MCFDVRIADNAIFYFRRFYCKESLNRYDPRIIAAGALSLSRKATDNTLTRSIVSRDQTIIVSKGETDRSRRRVYGNVPVDIVNDAEYLIFSTLQFDLVVFSPRRYLLQFGHDSGAPEAVMLLSFALLNDQMMTSSILCYSPYIIALGCLHVSFSLMKIDIRPFLGELIVDIDILLRYEDLIKDAYTHPIQLDVVQEQTLKYLQETTFSDILPSKQRDASSSDPLFAF